MNSTEIVDAPREIGWTWLVEQRSIPGGSKLTEETLLLKAHQNTKRNCHKSDLWRRIDVITKKSEKSVIRETTQMIITRKVIISAFQKCNSHWNWVNGSKVMTIQVKFGLFNRFYPEPLQTRRRRGNGPSEGKFTKLGGKGNFGVLI